MPNLKHIPENEQEGVLGTFWAMLKELESIAHSNENDVILRHELTNDFSFTWEGIKCFLVPGQNEECKINY